MAIMSESLENESWALAPAGIFPGEAKTTNGGLVRADVGLLVRWGKNPLMSAKVSKDFQKINENFTIFYNIK